MSVAVPFVKKIFVWNCALDSASGEVFDCCAHAHIGSSTRGCKGESALSCAAVPTLACLGKAVLFYSTCVVLKNRYNRS
jgi:hypothetical protein